VSTSHTVMFRPAEFYGEPHEWNGNPKHEDSFYFAVERTEGRDRLSSYISRETFNHLAGLLGVPPLTGVQS
jgi:hypothetical protein